ncbi:MAG: PEP-CTERM sorting domain-containing protein [Caenispirillum sp.]|nr:PEP-CTERM sorting domain-containing protein [Caenispirillum sp.]
MSNKYLRKLVTPLLAAAALSLPVAASAYDTPPVWMPMTMATITLDNTTGQLSMVDQSTFGPRCPGWSAACFSSNPLPLVTDVLGGSYVGYPDIASHLSPPTVSYADWDPAQPWSVLQGRAFSRQFGWWAGSSGSGLGPAALQAKVEAYYGTGASIWIELVSQTPGLETYKAVGKYGVDAGNTTTVTDPTAYTGLFGTAGSPLIWQWDYQMDHNTYAVDLNATNGWGQLFSATYRLYIGDNLGNELPAALGKHTLETWTWLAPVPEPETHALLLAGLGLVVALARSNRHRQAA